MFRSPVLKHHVRTIVKLEDCLLKESLKSTSIFPSAIPKFEVFEKNTNGLPYKYAILGHQKTQLLNALAMKYICDPPMSRTYPLIAETKKYDQIKYLNFKESSGLDKVHLSARYETFSYKGKLEMADDVNSVRNYITGDNNYNSNQEPVSEEEIQKVIELFNLTHLTKKWINSLSNGQLRRARIAKSILTKPKLLVIDDPFLGLDPIQTELVSASLNNAMEEFNMSIVLGLRFQDKIPEWVGHVAEVDSSGLKISGKKEDVIDQISQELSDSGEIVKDRDIQLVEVSTDEFTGPFHIEFDNASVVYKGLPVLQSFNWKIPPGSNWRILGENGTGKTTILSLITADHPQSWRSVLKIDDKLRKTGQGITFFDVNNAIGISSPELHALAPFHKTMNQIIKNGLVKDIGNSNFEFKGEKYQPNQKISTILDTPMIKEVLDEFGDSPFGQLTITHQKLALFLRAIIKDPRLIILDEAFSCMDDVRLMKACHDILAQQFTAATILTIGHIEWELPRYDYVIKLVGDDKRSYNTYKVE